MRISWSRGRLVNKRANDPWAENRQPLLFQHLLVPRHSPDNARYACYFYNRMQGETVRIVSHHLADRSEITEEMEDVVDAVHDLLSIPPSAGSRTSSR